MKSGGHVDELLRAIDFTISLPERDALFNFALPDESSTEQIVAAFARIAGYRQAHPTIPVAPLLMAASVFEVANRLGFRNPIHRERIMKLVQSTRVAPQWLLARGYRFETDLEGALAGWHAETSGRFD